MTSFRQFLSFASASVLAAAFLSLPASRAAEPLLLQWGTIDTASVEAQADSAALKAKVAKKAATARKAGAAAESRAAYVVQFPGPVTEEWRVWLESATQVRGYLPEFAYLVWATPSEMDAIASNENVFWTGEWKTEYKTVRVAAAKTASACSEARWIHVSSLLDGDDGGNDLRARIEALGATVRSAFACLDGSAAVALLTDAQIDEVAAWSDVEWIEPKLQPRLFNDQAARTNMMNVSNVWKSLSSGGLGLTGSGQIVAVADTGCDKGSTSDIHADFAGRVKAGYGWTNGAYKSSASWEDFDSHGTHVCGSVLGSGSKSSGQYKGIAYEAQLVMQGCWEDLGGLPDNVQNLFKQAYTAGARIHSDSWGYGTNYAGRYVYDAIAADGYMWTNQNFLALFAAGNDGIDANEDGVIDAGSVTPPSTSKNCICVGAAENWRSSGGYATNTYGKKWPSDYPADPIASDKISQTKSPQGIVAFSARGPTQDGRFKPDIVAPGTDIISVRSRASDDTGWGVNTANTNYLFMGGTSMATPLTSGATALVRQWLVDRKGINEPMAALMKALLINGARDMTPGQYGTDAYQEVTARPDRSQGFGHINLYNSLEPGEGNFLVFATNKLTTSANFTTNIAVGQPNAGKYLLTLVWQDYPGSSGGSKNLVNDLDLTVTSPSGTVYYPNNLTGLDHTNNVEFIEFTASETGDYAVKVNGYSVSKTSPHGGQPFALVMRGPETDLEEAAPAFSADTSSISGVQYEDIDFDFRALLAAGYPTPVYTLTTSVSTNEYDFDNDIGYLYYRPADAGTFTFQCVASNSLGTATNTLTVTVTFAPPAVPANLILSNVGTTSFDASWSAAANATSYSLDVATVSGSSTPTALISEDFSGCTAANSYANGSFEGDGGTWVYTNAIFAPDSAATSPGSAGRIQLKASVGYLHLPAVDNPSSFSINMAGSTTGTMTLDQYISGTWTPIANWDISATCATFSHAFTNAGAATQLRLYGSKALYIYDIEVSGVSASYASLSGYPKSVSGTSATVTGLSPSTDYAARVCGVNDGGTSDWSAWVSTTTTAGDFAPSWSAFPVQTYRYGSGDGYFNFDISPYVSGSPAPALSLEDTPLNAVLTEETGEFTFEPDALGDFSFTFAASNTLGVATNVLSVTVDAVAPEIAAIGDRSGTVGVDVEFALSATGDPAPVFDVTSSDAEAIVVEQSGTSYFLFSPDATGTFHFTITATNIAGTDSESFTITISDAPVTVPILAVTNIAATSALATWTTCDNVSSYTLQLASDDQFTPGGSGGTATLFSNTATSATAPDGWTYSINSASAGYVVLASGNYVVSPPVDASASIDLELSLSMRTYGGTGSGTTNLLVQYSADDGTSWIDLGTLSVPNKTWVNRTLDATSAAGNASLLIRFASSSPSSTIGVGISNLVLVATQSVSGGSLLFSTNVSATSFAFSDLTPSTTYYARVKGNADWSNVEEFLTEETPPAGAAPSWSADFPTNWSMTAGDIDGFDVTEYVSGTPTPTLSLVADAPDGDVDFEDGGFIYMPTQTGTFTFTFTASNDFGTADAVLVATVTGAAPTWDASFPATDTVAPGEDSEIENVSAYVSGSPSPTVALTSASSEDCDFDNDYFLFNTTTPGTYTFVFTASNVLGSADATLTVTVTTPEPPSYSYEQWIADNGYPEEPENTIAANGRTYWENYIADLDPTATNLLEFTCSLSDGSLAITSLSTNRDYQLLYYTNMLSAPPSAIPLGLGATNTNSFRFPLDATGFGRLRVTLPQ